MAATARFAFAILLSALLLHPYRAVQSPSTQSSQTSSPEGLRLLHKMQTALGGADKIAAIRDFEETVHAQIWTDAGAPAGEVTKRIRWMRSPNLLRLDQFGPRDTYVLFYDGGSSSGWEMLPDMNNANQFKTAGEAVALAGGELRFAKNYDTGFNLTVWLADRNPGFVVTSPAPNVVRVAHDGTAGDITLDPATGLPTKSSSVSLANPDRPFSAELRLSGWTEVNGVRFPAVRANYHNGVKLAEETDKVPLRINAGLKPDVLEKKPADFAPDIPSR
jgi:hypothetical protein